MDNALFDAALAKLEANPPAPSPANPALSPAPEAQENPSALSQAYASPATTDPIADPAAWQAEASERAAAAGVEPGLKDPQSEVNAVLGGAAKAIFETKDTLLGETPVDQRSGLRTSVEQGVDQLSKHSLYDGFAASIAQFATGMVGLGKFTKPIEAAAKGVKAAKAVGAGIQTAKAAAVGAVAFDPYQERLSNFVQGTALANPVTGWIQASPDDSRANARMKAALESIGLDAGIAGAFMGAGFVGKYLRSGDTASAAKWASKTEKSLAEAHAPVEETPNVAAVEAQPEAQAPQAPGAEAQGAGPGVQPVDAAQPAPADPALVAARGEPDGGVPASSGTPEAPATAEVPPQAVATKDANLPTETVVDNSTQAAASEGVDLNGNPTKAFTAPDPYGDVEGLLNGMKSDADAIERHGSWWGAVENAHTFGKGQGIPYAKLNQGIGARDDFLARIADELEGKLNAVKGGDVMSDATVERAIKQRAALFGEDPSLLMGLVQQSGKMAPRMVADMEAGYLVSNRMMQDAFALAQRITLGDLKAFGGDRAAAVAEMSKRVALAADMYAHARSITANVGRAMRRMRTDFKVDQLQAQALKDLDGEKLVELFVNSGGDPDNLKRLMNKSTLASIADYGKYVLVNNLVSGPKTQLINILTNGYMVGSRPMEKMLGGSLQRVMAGARGDAEAAASANFMVREAWKTYGYYATVLTDAFDQAKRAFMANDSVLRPHRTEAFAASRAGEVAVSWRPMEEGLGALMHNALMAGHVAIGMPTRTLGFVDELVKQTVYRAKVAASAHVEAVDAGMAQGFEGDALQSFVRKFVAEKVDGAFDELGRGINTDALREAQIATFQQDLLPGTIGSTAQWVAAQHPVIGYVLPFIKTPTNVIRYGWKLTPGLNVLQTEFRSALKGDMGAALQAEAVGQMTLGSLFMGTAATLAANGLITGGGPQDARLRKELLATGWQPYSVVRSNADGSKTFVPFGRYDPVMVPFGVVADVIDAMHAAGSKDQEGAKTIMVALLVSIGNQFRNKTYLLSASQALDAIMDDDPAGSKIEAWAGRQAANFVPFSAGLRQFNPDPYLRETRDLTDRMMANVPGLSDKLPPRYDAFGDPIVNHGKVFFYSHDGGDAVAREMQRLTIETGAALTSVQPRPEAGVDLRDITMADGKNAYAEYQRLAGHPESGAQPLRAAIGELIAADGYRRAPDGDATTKGTKLWLMARIASRYREVAMRQLRADPEVFAAFTKKQRDVAAAYEAQAQDGQGGSSSARAERSSQPDLGKAFGLDLSGAFGTGNSH